MSFVPGDLIKPLHPFGSNVFLGEDTSLRERMVTTYSLALVISLQENNMVDYIDGFGRKMDNNSILIFIDGTLATTLTRDWEIASGD